MTKPIAILGNSGHAFVVLESLSTMNVKAEGYFDKQPNTFNPFVLKYLGFEGDEQTNLNEYQLIMGIGDNQIRRKSFERIISRYSEDLLNQDHTNDSKLSAPIENDLLRILFLNVIDISSNVSQSAVLGAGNYIGKGTTINAFAHIGSNCILNTHCIIEHECQISDHCHIAPGSVLLGNVQIGTGSLIGANSTILPGIMVGANVVVGAGSVVTKNIPDNGKWIGNKIVN
jgi:acetyltransferase-like isoleucine patch superfamily enzyme